MRQLEVQAATELSKEPTRVSRPESNGPSTIMKSAQIAAPAPEDEPGFVVLAQGSVLKAEPAGPCPRCSRWEEPSCDCHRLKELSTLFNAAMIPALYIKATLQPLETHNESSASLRRTVKAVQQWARRERPPEQGLLLSGPNGVGKSFLMAALARSLTLEHGIRCLFVDFGNLLLRIKATFNGQGLELRRHFAVGFDNLLKQQGFTKASRSLLYPSSIP